MIKNLAALYKEPYLRFREDFILKSKVTDDWAFPFLLKPSEEYIKSKLKLMIIGQETMGWNSEQYQKAEEATVESLQERYDLFVNNGGFNSPYWQFQKAMKEKLASSVGFLSNNVVKIGCEYDPGYIKEVLDWQLEHFNIFSGEIEVCQPDVMIFLTGPRYDKVLRLSLGRFSATCVDPNIRCLHILRFEKYPDLPVIRTYHPRYLRLSKKWESALGHITEFVNNHC